jgi:YidC/Oxa1 family membrane protein insertase
MNLLPLLVPLGLWEDFLGLLNTMMTPLYWAVSGLLVAFHSFFSLFLDPGSGWAWALSIVLLTVVIRTALIPLFVKQINSARNMQLLGPKLKVLQDKYAGDRERLGQETMKLYQSEGVNPMASCLPLLLQMPIFLSLFHVLNSVSRATDASHVVGQFLQQDWTLVQSLQNATIFGAHISQTFFPFQTWSATQTLALVLIILMTGILYITQLQLMRKNMPPEAMTGPMAQQQKMMLYLFPVMYAIGGVNIPIGVLIYWLTTNLWTMGQQYILIHNNPAPNTPAYVDWEERMRAKGKDPDAIAAKRRGTRKRPAADTDYDPTKVARQGAARPAGAGTARPSGSGTSAEVVETTADEGGKVVVQRQQPKKNTRAKRKS